MRYLLLIAKSEGFDTSPMLGFQADQVKQILGIPAHATITALVALGRGADDGFRSHRHTVERIGVQHVAIGSDWDGAVAVPFDAANVVRLTDALLDVGLDEPAIRAVMGENVLRVLAAGLPPA